MKEAREKCIISLYNFNNWKDNVPAHSIRQHVIKFRINEDENLEALSPRRCQGRGCSRGLNLDGEKGRAYF
jgi:hypothetical protein